MFIIIAISAPIFKVINLPEIFDKLYNYSTSTELIAYKVWDAWTK